LLKQNPPLLNWGGGQLIQVVLYTGCKIVVVVVVVVVAVAEELSQSWHKHNKTRSITKNCKKKHEVSRKLEITLNFIPFLTLGPTKIVNYNGKINRSKIQV